MNRQAFLHHYFNRVIALPQDHGSWVFLLSPLLIGLFSGEHWRYATTPLIGACLAAFLIRQPASMVVKILSGRRPRSEFPVALFWSSIYAALGLLMLVWLVWLGWGRLLLLALPGLPVFTWHLLLVSRRSERGQIGVEVVGSGVLALAAPAAFWVGQNHLDPLGWGLLMLAWLQSAASIVYAYLRLQQRTLKGIPLWIDRLRMAQRALLYTTFNLILVSGLSLARILPVWLFLPYLLQWGETVWGSLQPAIGWKPTRVGLRQLVISTAFTVLFILAWRL
jgi:hypothetical protein